MPVPVNRTDDAYFHPLLKLSQANDTELYLGLVHDSDTLDENLDEEYQEEACYIEQEDKDLKTIDVNLPIGSPNPANLELQ